MLIPSTISKIEHYCAYQERCHEEVKSKLIALKVPSDEIDAYLVYLIEHNFVNEERFACAFARGKHNIKKWGRLRITNELKFRQISKFNIETALKEITEKDYQKNFHELAEKEWNSIKESNPLKKKKKFCDFLYRKGYESHFIFDKLEELEKMENE